MALALTTAPNTFNTNMHSQNVDLDGVPMVGCCSATTLLTTTGAGARHAAARWKVRTDKDKDVNVVLGSLTLEREKGGRAAGSQRSSRSNSQRDKRTSDDDATTVVDKGTTGGDQRERARYGRQLVVRLRTLTHVASYMYVTCTSTRAVHTKNESKA